jgi:hypothetical protein
MFIEFKLAGEEIKITFIPNKLHGFKKLTLSATLIYWLAQRKCICPTVASSVLKSLATSFREGAANNFVIQILF